MSRDTDQKRRDNAATNDATGRQNDATRDTTERDSDATPARQTATIGDAAKVLGVSVRTVQRRIERGELSIIERDGRRFVELEVGTTLDATPSATGTRQGDRMTRHATRHAATVDATPRQNDATRRNSDAERIAELKAEVAFLRNVVEAQQRDAVETRQALKRALDLAPKQLTNGAAPTTAPEAQEEPQIRATTNHSHADPSDPHKPARREDVPLTYADIADELERSLNR